MLACGGIAPGLGDASTDDASSGNDSSTSPDVTVTTIDGGTAGCPASPPTSGASCGSDGLECEYGSDARLACNVLATCQAGSWQISQGADCFESQPGENGCPLDRSSIQPGTACSTQTTCDYDGGVCACGFSGHPPTEEWVCDGPPDQGCPYPRPKLGTPCNSVAQIICNYGSCSALGGSSQICQNGTWHFEDVPCPP